MLAFDKLPRLCCSQHCANSSRTRPFVAGRLCCGFKSVIPIAAPVFERLLATCRPAASARIAHRTTGQARISCHTAVVQALKVVDVQLQRRTNKARSTGVFCPLQRYLSHAACLKVLRPNNVLPLRTHGSAVWLGHSKSALRANEIQSGCIYGFVGRACREILRSGSQRSGFLARDLPERSRASCITSYIIVGRASKDWLSRVSETRPDRGSTRSGSRRNGVRQARSCISLSQPS